MIVIPDCWIAGGWAGWIPRLARWLRRTRKLTHATTE